MRTRSKTTSSLHLRAEINSAPRIGATARPQRRDRLLRLTTEHQKLELTNKFTQTYRVPAQEIQVNSVPKLVQNSNVFLLASTGFGNTRVPELYHLLHLKQTNPIVLILNPLDALGDN